MPETPPEAIRYRVIQVVNSLAPAGAERLTTDLAGKLDPEVWDVHILIVRDGELRRSAEEAGVQVFRTGHGFDHTAPFVIAKMVRHFRQVRPHVVHTHLLGSDIVGRLAALLAGVPVIVSTQHDTHSRPILYDVYRRITGRMIASTIACSDSVGEFCRRQMKIPSSRLTVIENGVDVSRFPKSPPAMKGPLTFGAVGSLIELKGHRYLLDAFTRIASEFPDSRLVIAGEGPERASLVARAKEAGLGERVELPGIVRDIPGFLEETDVFVHPSLTEGMPMAVLEAMASARPVIVTDISCLADVVDHGRSGLLVPAEDEQALSEAMRTLGNGREAAIAMGARARQRVRDHYSLTEAARLYGELYLRLLRERGMSPESEPYSRNHRIGVIALRFAVRSLFLGAVVFFAYQSLAAGFGESGFLNLEFHPFELVSSIVLLVGYYAAFVGGLKLLFEGFGIRIPYRDVFKLSFMSNLGKYVPGGVWPIASRLVLAKRLGIERHRMLVVAVTESALSVMGGLVVVLSAVAFRQISDRLVSYQSMFVAVVAMFTLLYPQVFRRVIRLIMRVMRVPGEPPAMSFGKTVGLVFYYAGTWMIAGAAFNQFTHSLVSDAGISWFGYAAVYALGAVVGLLVLFAPGGIGAREGTIMLMLSGVLGAPMATVVALSARVWSTIVELFMSGLATVLRYTNRDDREVSMEEK